MYGSFQRAAGRGQLCKPNIDNLPPICAVEHRENIRYDVIVPTVRKLGLQQLKTNILRTNIYIYINTLKMCTTNIRKKHEPQQLDVEVMRLLHVSFILLQSLFYRRRVVQSKYAGLRRLQGT